MDLELGRSMNGKRKISEKCKRIEIFEVMILKQKYGNKKIGGRKRWLGRMLGRRIPKQK